jgi:hypothetical protein
LIEQGFVLYITTGLGALSIIVPGGFAAMLPQNLISVTNPQAWTYRTISSTPLYSLTGQNSFTSWEVQIDCCGFTMTNVITLARAITSVLSGAPTGVFTDPDETVFLGIFQQPSCVDSFSEDNRSFVRSLEYRINYYQI